MNGIHITNVVFNLEIQFNSELRKMKMENEYSYSHGVYNINFTFIQVNESSWLKLYIYEWMKECQQSKQLFTFHFCLIQIIQNIQRNLRNSDIRENIFTNRRKTNVFVSLDGREWAHQGDPIFVCLHKLLFWMTRKFSCHWRCKRISNEFKKKKNRNVILNIHKSEGESLPWIRLF